MHQCYINNWVYRINIVHCIGRIHLETVAFENTSNSSGYVIIGMVTNLARQNIINFAMMALITL